MSYILLSVTVSTADTVLMESANSHQFILFHMFAFQWH